MPENEEIVEEKQAVQPEPTDEELNPQPDNPEPEKQRLYGTVIYSTKEDPASSAEIADADIVIEDKLMPVIVKSRNGLDGVVASPDMIEEAENQLNEKEAERDEESSS